MLPVRGATMALAAGLILVAGCGGRSLLKQYEYEEEIYLALDGSATVYVNGSVPALVSLRGLDLDVRPRARLDRLKIRRLFEAPGVRVVRVSGSRRLGRRFVHVRLDVDDIRALPALEALGWSEYDFARRDDSYVFVQTVGAASSVEVGDVGWRGDELVAFRLHLPSRITYHDAGPDNLRRGNILVWEQDLAERRAGVPLHMEARMETQSILYRTLWLFAATAAVVAATFAVVVILITRRGRQGDPHRAGVDVAR